MNIEIAKEMWKILKVNKENVKGFDKETFFEFGETVLSELEKKDKKLHSLEWDLRNIKRDLDFEPWSTYRVEGNILFDMAQQIENKVEREGK